METTNTGTIASMLDKGKLFLKAVVIFIMALGLWIPTFFVKEVIHEREGRQKEAIADISSKWADKQTVTGPLLRIPYFEDAKDEKGNAVLVKKMLSSLQMQWISVPLSSLKKDTVGSTRLWFTGVISLSAGGSTRYDGRN
ncbi:MAG: cell envelope integrity protein CreD [Bacteroidia bacterium]|nr:cell envelope integrity protein CreD [Bacteroidia bacterium]